MKNSLEIEFKYYATDISLTKFKEFCSSLSEKPQYLEASGFDYFWDKKADEDGFYRIRISPDLYQLTYKLKTSDSNNYIRGEDNLDFAKSMTRSRIESYIAAKGYEFNRSLFKNCFIYKFGTYTLVYYVCYDEDLKELGRFIEIEMSEEHPWPTQQDAWNELIAMERICKPLGITAQARVKRSLFELYRK